MVTRFRKPDFLVADIADQLIDINRCDLECFEHLGRVLNNGAERSLQAILCIQKVLMVGNSRADRQDEQRQDD
jgi:hypothetical protein